MLDKRAMRQLTRRQLQTTDAQRDEHVDRLNRKRCRKKFDADLVAMRLNALVLRLRQFEPLQHQKLVLVSCLPCLILRSRRTTNHQVFCAKSLKLHSIGTSIFCSIAKLQSHRQITVVIDTGFGNDKNRLDYHAVHPPSTTRLWPVMYFAASLLR